MNTRGKTFVLLILPAVLSEVSTQMTGEVAPARLGQFKYTVTLWYRGAHNTCVGVLISSRHVLTTGHCLYNRNATEFWIYAGTVDMEARPQAVRKGQIAYTHTDYMEPAKDKEFERPEHDIGILVMNRPIILEKNIDKIALPAEDVVSCTSCTVTGWGSTVHGQQAASNVLLWGHAVTLSEQKCEDIGVDFVRIGEFCAIDEYRVSRPYKRYSGGPLVCNDQVTGLESRSLYNPEMPLVYINVWYYKNFIDNVLEGKFSTNCDEL